MQALALFKHRSLYANVVNDRTVSYYTAAISKIDPFVQPDEIKVNYLEGYEDVILNGKNPASAKDPEELPAFTQRLTNTTRMWIGRVPIIAFLIIFIPIGTTLFLINSGFQSIRSSQRIKMHERGQGGFDIGGYRIPLMINGMRQEVEDIYESINNAQEQEYLLSGSEEHASPSKTNLIRKESNHDGAEVDSIEERKTGLAVEFPTLALTPDQFAMIDALNQVGFKKYPVYIHKHRHSHAAIIRRMDKTGFEEGRIVAKHWLNEFEL